MQMELQMRLIQDAGALRSCGVGSLPLSFVASCVNEEGNSILSTGFSGSFGWQTAVRSMAKLCNGSIGSQLNVHLLAGQRLPAVKVASMVRVLEEGAKALNSDQEHLRGNSLTLYLRGLAEEIFTLAESAHVLMLNGENSTDQVTCGFIQAFDSIEELNNQCFSYRVGECENVECKDNVSSLHGVHVFPELPPFQGPELSTLSSEPEETSTAEFFISNCETELGESFVDDDGIIISRVLNKLSADIDLIEGTSSSRFRVSIPKAMMRLMPTPPNDYASQDGLNEFNIEIWMTGLNDLHHVDVCIDWLLQDYSDAVGLVCRHRAEGSLNLIQISAHQRCVLIRVPCYIAKASFVPMRLRAILSESRLLKVGTNIQKDVLAIFHFLGVVTNNCIRISQYFGQKKRKNLRTLFREMFQWEFCEKGKKSYCVSRSQKTNLDQVKYAVLDAWASRLVWVGQTKFLNIWTPAFSLGDLPWILLDYFGRSIFKSEVKNQRDEVASVEVKDAVVELHRGYLCLKQKNYRSRVMGQKSIVELRFKDGRKPQKYTTLSREGCRVVLENAEPLSSVKGVEELQEEMTMISRVLVDNSTNSDVQKQKLEESLYVLLCVPGACPQHILAALGFLQNQMIMIPPRQFSLEETMVQNCNFGLNTSQLEAWKHMLSSPLSAVIGPPGTGKTTVISAVAKAWIQLVEKGETLLCTAHQNVAVRHLAEKMVKEKLPGVLLLVSEDYYVGWHEDEYAQAVKDVVVVSGSQTTSALQRWMDLNGAQAPKILLCTLTLIGSESFQESLMGNTVSSMIIDECSQAAEGSLIPALGALPHLHMLSVVGDPCQLPPFGLRQSVFDLLSQNCDVKLLQEQYRMPYRVAKFESSEFYGGRLHTDMRKMWKDSPRALLWVNVKGKVDGTSGTSLSNQTEAEAVLECCRKLKEGCMIGKRGKLAVLTLYEAQRSLISGMLEEQGMGQEVMVYNADSFQGQEADIVLISLVVTDRISSFAADRRRACVLLSRAKHELLIFGNLEFIQGSRRVYGTHDYHNPSAKNIWMRLANYCKGHGWVIGQKLLKSLAY